MFKLIKLFQLFAAVYTAAFFLYGEQTLLPKVEYRVGKVELIEETNSSQKRIYDLESNQTITYGTWIASGKGSRTEFQTENYTLRLGSMSVGTWNNPTSFWLHSGSILFCTTEDLVMDFSSIEAKATFSGRGTFIIEALKNGGFKFIPLEADGKIITAQGGEIKIIDGRMLLVLGQPSYFGDAYDLDVMLLVKSSRLLNSFPSPLPTFGRIGLSIYKQELKLRGKYNALIGDSPTKDKLHLWSFENKEKE